MNAKRKQDGLYIDYTAGTAGVSAGDIIIQGNIVGVADIDIPANGTGALTTEGVYGVVTASTTSFTAGQKVYWDATNKVATGSTTGTTYIGCAIEAVGTATGIVKVKLG